MKKMLVTRRKKMAFIESLGLPVLALLMMSCSRGDAVEDGPVAARFTAGIDGSISRASGTFWSVGDGIGVTGTSGALTYSNYKYTADKASEGSTFSRVPGGAAIYYMNDAAVSFTAYYPFAGTDGTAVSPVSVNTGSPAQGTLSLIDYLHGEGTGSKSSPGVEFTFRHVMSQLVLNIKSGDGLASLETLTGYTLGDFRLTGTFSPADGSTTTTDISSSLTLALTVGPGVRETSSTLILLPQSLSRATFTTTLDGQSFTGTLDIPDGELKPGYSYTYNVTASKTGLNISKATITGWKPATGGDVTAK